MTRFKQQLITATISVYLLALAGNGLAAPGEIANEPLNLGTSVDPNIFLLLDDSGSMDNEAMLNDGTDPDASSNHKSLDYDSAANFDLRLLCAGFNVLAYNPEFVYTPWEGYDNASYNSGKMGSRYVAWDDKDKDGEYDGPGSTNKDANHDSNDECDIANPVSITGLSAAQQQNYANWYTYYRKRQFVMKRAVSSIIADSMGRMGLMTLVRSGGPRKSVTVDNVATIHTLDDESTISHQQLLLDTLFSINPKDNTPLRLTLSQAGEYYKGNYSKVGSSPILAEGGQCQQNFSILMSDGFWNGGNPSVGNADGDNNSDWDGGIYADNQDNTLADVAMHYYENDLMPNMANQVPTIPGVDENPAQHMNTYTVAFGVKGSSTQLPIDKKGKKIAGGEWGSVNADEASTIDDMIHAAFNGRGMFLDAGNPAELISSLKTAISDIVTARRGTNAALELSSTSIYNGALAYATRYDSSDWHGTVEAYKINISTDEQTGEVSYHFVQQWTSDDTLSKLDHSSRKVLTYDGSKTVDFAASNLNSEQQLDLLTGNVNNDPDYINKIVAYFKGDTTHEVAGSGDSIFRKRNGYLMGDIVSSGALYVGTPDTAYPTGISDTSDSYADFIKTNENRKAMVYVASNDGILRGLDALSGAEVFAYIPGIVFSTQAGQGLHALAKPTYQHKYYLDSNPTIADVYTNGSWKTVLVGARGAAGNGMYGLDITNPSSPKTLFEIMDKDVGYTMARAQIVKVNAKTGDGVGRWAAIYGNGYNNTGSGSAQLVIVFLDDGSLVKIDTGVGSVATDTGTGITSCSNPGSNCNGLSSPQTADINGDGSADRVYAADVQGNLWAFDISNADSRNWDLAYSSPLFSAPAGQAITTKPTIARHKTMRVSATAPNIMVMVGTGQYLNSSDISNTETQSFYGVWDRGTHSITRSNMLQRNFIGTGSLLTVEPSQSTINYNSTADSHYGWFLDLEFSTGDGNSKESMGRVISNPHAYGDLVFLQTFLPGATQMCSSSSNTASGWLVAVNLMDGGAANFAVFDINKDQAYDAGDMLEIESVKHQVSAIKGGGSEGQLNIASSMLLKNTPQQPGVERIQALNPEFIGRDSWSIISD